MKAKTFENLIRKIVREEIDYALRREIKSLKEDIRDELTPQITENKKLVSDLEENSNSLRKNIMGKPNLHKSVPKQQFVSNTTLNDLLNETAQGDTNLNKNQSPVSLAESLNQPSDPMDTTGMPPVVADAVTRDYSSLMKAIDKKKKNRP